MCVSMVICNYRKGKTKNQEETEMAKTKWIVKVLTAKNPGEMIWQDLKVFDSPAEADSWLADYIMKNGYNYTNFNIVRR